MSVKLFRQRKTKGVMYVRNIPKSIKDEFKATCFRRGMTQEKAIEIVMVAFCKRPSKVEQLSRKLNRDVRLQPSD